MIYLTTELTEDVLNEVIFYILDEEKVKTRKRRRTDANNLQDSVWGRLLRSPEIGDEGSFTNKKFRRRLRVPYRLFAEVLVPMCTAMNIFKLKNKTSLLRLFRKK